jgi:hypothetical protein
LNDDIDEQYRRAAADHASRPSDAVRRAVLAHSAAIAAERAALGAPDPPVRTVNRKWRPAVWGGLAAAGLAGLLLLPRLQEPPERAQAPPVPRAASPPLASPALQPAEPPSPTLQPAEPAPRAAQAAQEALAKLFEAAPSAARQSPQAAAASGGRAADGRQALQWQSKIQPNAGVNSAATLRRSAASGDLASLRTLLDEGADADGRDAAGRTALLLAVMQGHAAAVDLLLAHGANPNAEDTAGLRPLAAAMSAQRLDIAAALRRAGAR